MRTLLVSNPGMRRGGGLAVALAVLLAAADSIHSQERSLTIVSATPSGEVAQIADAGEIRIVFSEPMVAIGGEITRPPEWLSVTPAIRANYYWSGTRTLIVTADPDTPLPFATRYAATIGAGARSAAGHALASPFAFTFTTPTIRLLGADWYRKTGRYDSPAVIALRFNQPVRAADVLAHAAVHYTPHVWTAPTLTGPARERLANEDRDGLGRFDAKVAHVVAVTGSTEAVPVTSAFSWDEKRFPPASNLAVIETAGAPATDGWLTIELDGRVPGLGGSETAAPQSSVIRLEPTFFVNDVRCMDMCPSALQFRRGVALENARLAMRADAESAGRLSPVARTEPAPAGFQSANGTSYVSFPQLGYPNQPPATSWVVRLDAALTSVDGQVLGYPWLEVLQNPHAPPYAEWTGSVLESGNGTSAPVLTRNVTGLYTWASPIAAADLLPRLLRFRQSTSLSPDGPPTRAELSIQPDAPEMRGFDLARALSSSGGGLAWAAFVPREVLPGSAGNSDRTRVRAALLQVTNLGLTVKDSPQSTLIYVTTLDHARPVAGARVTIRTEADAALWTGLTGEDGIAMAPALKLRDPQRTWNLSYVVTAEKDGDTAWVGSDWTGDVEPGRMGLNYWLDSQPDRLRGSMFTDRGVYVKGEDVHLKGLFRNDTPAGMQTLTPSTALEAIVRDPRGAEIDRRRLSLNRWSAADWVVRLPAEPSLGHYSVTVAVAGTVPDWRSTLGTSFEVAAFRRPDFRVDATLTAATPVLGESLHAVAKAQYLFGAPIGPQPARWYVTRQMVAEVPEPILQRFPDRQFAFGYRPEASESRRLYEQIVQKNENLDQKGTLAIDWPTQAGDDWASNFHFEAEVPNASGQPIANRADLVLHPASFYVGLGRPPFFVNVKDGLKTSVVAADLNGAARSGVAVHVSLWREEWGSAPDPRYAGSVVWTRKEVAAGEWTVTSSSSPVPLTAPLKDGGSFVLRATATDEHGRPTRTDVHFYAIGGGISLWKADGNKITLVPERATWKPGETARILVQSPWPAATALVTTEREGVRTHRQIAITSTQDTIDVPITAADIPNVYVSVLLVKGRTPADARPDDDDPGRPGFRLGCTQLMVDDATKRLTVAVKADRTEYQPHQPVTVSVAVTDPAGKPQSGEVTLWAVDYGVLSLTDYKAPDVARAIYAPKQLQVMTQDNRARLIARHAIVDERVGAGAGGRGGGGENALSFVPAPPPAPSRAPGLDNSQFNMTIDGVVTVSASSDLIRADTAIFTQTLPRLNAVEEVALQSAPARTDFRSLVFWLGSVETDATGHASTTVTLPDSLTTYRIIAVAGDVSSRFGAGDAEIHTAKALTLLPEFPRFLSTGDRASLSAIVTNNMKTAGDATVTIRALDTGRLTMSSAATRTIHLEAGESRAVTFDATASADGPARVRMAAVLGSAADAFDMPIPISAPLHLETVAAYGDTIATATEKLRLPPDSRPDWGGLSVSLASTALVGLGESARYLDEYPYECAEQKASRALALLLAADLGGAFSLSSLKPADLRTQGLGLLRELSSYQCGDGGFALFPGSCYGPSSTYLTAYVLDVMQRAGVLKAQTDSTAMNRALDFLQLQLRQPPPEAQWWPAWAASQAYAVRTLAVGHRNPRQDIDRLYSLADRMPVFALSYLADTLEATGDRGARYQDVIRRITNALRVDADRAHVEEVDDAALLWLWNTNVRATAVVLDGLSRRKDNEALVASLVRWLLAARENGRWGTTHENATALAALVNYYKAFESDVPNMTATVRLAGRAVGQSTFLGRTTSSQEVHIDMPDLMRQVAGAATQDLSVSRAGTGRVYYTARLEYATPIPPAPVDRGIRVERRYQRYTPDALGQTSTTFETGDLVRVTLTVSLPHEGRFLAFTDPLPAGFEPVDGSLKTTATDLGSRATTQSSADWYAWWRRGGFDFVEKHDDRVVAFATRLAAGRHEFTYLVRATTAGTFSAPGTFGEAMYAPEIMGRGAAGTVRVK